MKQPPYSALELSRDVEQYAEQKVEQEVERDVEVILVVKGAGLHQPGDVLQQFMRGFWPAVNAATKVNGVPQTANTMRMLRFLEGYEPPAHVDKERAKLMEIGLDPLSDSQIDLSTKHVWIKEAYWELGGQPPGRWRSLWNEWYMASYALTSEFSGWLKSIPLGLVEWLRKRVDPESIDSADSRTASNSRIGRLLDRVYRWFSGLDFVYNYMSYWLFYMLLLWVVFLVLDPSEVVELISKLGDLFSRKFGLLTLLLSSVIDVPSTTIRFVMSAILALLLSWAPAYLITTGDPDSPARYSSISPLITYMMAVAFFFNNWLYLGIMLLLMAPLVINNLNRILWWKHRIDSNTDRRYHRSRRDSGAGGAVQTELLHIFPDLVLYRLNIILLLPILTLALVLADILIFTRVLGGPGQRLERSIDNFLGGLLGDVSVYAMDPSTAVQVRSAVEYDIVFFDEIERVRHIHVFAHSQGTPISFETLFTHMPKTFRRKIKTYVTIGSVLGFYNVIAPILDKVSHPSRLRKTDYEVETFAPGFRWFNCWNLTDNVTGFGGLDAYDLILHQGGNTTGAERLPTNIRTRTRGHSEYWSNLKEVQKPFARRVIEDTIDERWKLTPTKRTGRHAVGKVLSWLLLAAGLAALAWIFKRQLIVLFIPTLNLSLWEVLGKVDGLLRGIDLLQPTIDGLDHLGDLLSPLGDFLADDVLRTIWIMACLIGFELLNILRSIFVWMGSKPTLPEEA